MKVREDSVKVTVEGTSTCSFLKSVKVREGSVKATVKLKVPQQRFLHFLWFPACVSSVSIQCCVTGTLRNFRGASGELGDLKSVGSVVCEWWPLHIHILT